MSSNGQIPRNQLKAITGGGLLRSDAAKAFNAFAKYCRVKHGVVVHVTDSYRPLGKPGDLKRGKWSQWAAWEKYQAGGSLAADPRGGGTSNHGWGIALDLPTPTQRAVNSWGAAFGWDHKYSDAQSEPWHYKFNPGTAQKKVIARWSQIQVNETCSLGNKGPGVHTLKVLLRRNGFWPYPSKSTLFGRATKLQVRKFQKAKGLTADGICGPGTWKALRKKKPTPKPKPKPKPAPKPKPTPRPEPKPTKAVKGIDISNNNGTPFKFSNVKADGYDFVIVKTTEGGDWKDPSYSARLVSDIRHAGLKLGTYHYLRPKAGRSGAVEARWYWETATSTGYGKKGDIVPVIDFEETALPPGATYRYVAEAVKELTRLSGKAPMIYTGGPFWNDKTKMAKDNWGCPLWLAAYVKDPNRYIPEAWDTWTIWQYSADGSVKGVPSAKCDVNTAKRLPLL